jgi:tryptophan halogenase
VKIVVVGGGSSGWLVASGLIKRFPHYEISVVESKTIPTIGVGESTTTLVRHFIKNFLQIDENEFLKNVDGIYKMSVKFNNFSIVNDSYHYPFANPVVDGDLHLSYWDIVKHFNQDLTPEDFIKYTYPASHLFLNNKVDTNEDNKFDNFDFKKNMAYHFDANKLGVFLREKYCIPRKVKHIVGTVLDVNFADNKVESLTLDDGSRIKADIFVDCTGYKSILLGQKMKPRFVDTSHKLLNNRAWATPVKYKDVYKQMQPYTTATAIENGWCWYTPIASRIGNGYAYSDRFTDSQQALKQFKNYLAKSKNYSLTKSEIDSLPFFQIEMKTGFYEESMIKNVVAIGMSSGFLEPLEGTGLHFIIEETFTLFKIIEHGVPNQFLIDSFNVRTKSMYQTWTDSLSMFYLLSGRTDTEYWKAIFNMRTTDLDLTKVSHHHGINDYSTRILYWAGHNFREDLFNIVLRGSGIVSAFDEADAQTFAVSNGIDIEAFGKELSSYL